MKGGYWSNAEDEILKAAVIKYGFNQWSRISSLIARKSAKQCKARWYEWLDPSIKKTPWTKEEEEKLLHLAKTFPSQWRTIAPIVGRTPSQCVQHYELLLDQAQGRDRFMENDPRVLRPGEIDPTPEIRPARADPKDMDDAQKEQIAEARVRLINIKGKKPKRRAREKFIERSKQMAQLQKERELKAAGIEYIIEKKKKKKKEEIDYNKEIPFESRPIDIVYRVGDDEKPLPNPNISNISVNQLEGERRDVQEKKMRKLDKKRIKKLMSKDLPAHINKLNKTNPLMYQKKQKLVLSDAQLNDKDLELLGKMTKNAAEIQTQSGSFATKRLLGNYSIREPTPVRTPRISSQLMREARNAIALSKVDTPLVGGENPMIEASMRRGGGAGIGVGGGPLGSSLIGEGANREKSSTPNPYKNMIQKTPLSSYRGETPLSVHSVRQEPRKSGVYPKNPSVHDSGQATPALSYSGTAGGPSGTPLLYNDELNLNNDDWTDEVWEGTSTAHEDSLEVKQLKVREMIKKAFKNLPKPSNDFEIVVPDLEEFRKKEAMLQERAEVVDYEDMKRHIEQKSREKQMRNMIKRTRAVKQKLPRPQRLPKNMLEKLKGTSNDPEQMIERKIVQLMVNDAVDFPLGKRTSSEMVNFYSAEDDDIDVEDLEKAEFLIEEEMRILLKEREISLEEVTLIGQQVLMKQFEEDWSRVALKKKGSKRSKKSRKRRVEMLQEGVTQVKEVADQLEKEVMDPEQQTSREQALKKIEQLTKKINNKRIELGVFKKLKEQEESAALIRLQEMDRFSSALKDKESTLQTYYKRVQFQLEDLKDEEILKSEEVEQE